MVGIEYQAEVPACLCHYKDGEKGDYCVSCFQHVPNMFFNVAALFLSIQLRLI